MTEHRLFDPADPPDWLDPEYWRDTPNCNHLAHAADVHIARLRRAARLAAHTAYANHVEEIVDIGAGDGALLEMLDTRTPGIELTGYEIIDDSRKFADLFRSITINDANVTKEAAENLDTAFTRHVCKATRGTRLVVATEFFEHLADPHVMVRWLSERTEWLVASSPWGETPDRHEDNHAWAWDQEGYLDLFRDNGFEMTSQEEVEWSQIIVARRAGMS